VLVVENPFSDYRVDGVHANGVVVTFGTEVVCFVILAFMILIRIRSTIFQTFPITNHNHRHLRLVAIIVEIHPKKDYLVNGVFVIDVDLLIVCAML
jgi:hypothetical protein